MAGSIAISMSPLKAEHSLDDTSHCTGCELLFVLEHGHFCWVIYPASRFVDG
jgi:hypothetical protein